MYRKPRNIGMSDETFNELKAVAKEERKTMTEMLSDMICGYDCDEGEGYEDEGDGYEDEEDDD